MGRCKGGNPHIQKTECFIREFLLDKETLHVNWESGVEDGLQVRGGFGSVDASYQRTHR